MLTTTSPNSILLASLDATQAEMSEHGSSMMEKALHAAEVLRSSLKSECKMSDMSQIRAYNSKNIKLFVDISTSTNPCLLLKVWGTLNCSMTPWL